MPNADHGFKTASRAIARVTKRPSGWHDWKAITALGEIVADGFEKTGGKARKCATAACRKHNATITSINPELRASEADMKPRICRSAEKEMFG